MANQLAIHSLAVRIITSKNLASGTDNTIYFSIGCLAWKLDTPRFNDFKQGNDTTYCLTLPKNLILSTDDLLWMKLQKKGIFGVSGTGDGLDGGWRPHAIQLIVNGEVLASTNIDEWLEDRSHPEWQQDLRAFAGSEERFVRSLRLYQNGSLSDVAKAAAVFTTPALKLQGISGWRPTALPLTCATGIVIREPFRSTDGFATIDLRLESIQVGDQVFILDGQHAIGHTRYIRVEYQFGPIGTDLIVQGSTFPVPVGGARVTICGEVWVDTDDETWYEIHPRGSFDVNPLPDRGTGNTQSLSLVQTIKSWNNAANLNTGIRPIVTEILPATSPSYSLKTNVLLALMPAPTWEGSDQETPKDGRC